ncbi:MAG: hypothetical protein KDB40_06680 [Acidimicrobiales bacterium]|nr:hypothetical protein [Acidimicrobiales bacterium]MCB9393764.1 hypothetical protein [Acidimicrobiaceae bacterium]
MYTLCWSAKGGSGATLVAASLAMVSARSGPTVLVDLGGDLPALLGVDLPDGPGVGDWLASPHATPESLARLAVEVAPDLQLVPAGRLDDGRPIEAVHAERLGHACSAGPVEVVVDAGPHARHHVLHACARQSLLVTRPEYLALRRAVRLPGNATGVVVVREPVHQYRTADIASIVGAPILADVHWDPAMARLADQGLLGRRFPTAWMRAIERVRASAPTSAPAVPT